jgi:hypothetical protein
LRRLYNTYPRLLTDRSQEKDLFSQTGFTFPTQPHMSPVKEPKSSSRTEKKSIVEERRAKFMATSNYNTTLINFPTYFKTKYME